MIKEIKIKASVEDDMLKGNLEVAIRAKTEPGLFLWACIEAEDGKEADRIFPIPLERQMQFCMQIPDVRLWDAETVYLYTLTLELKNAEGVLVERIMKKAAFYRWDMETEGCFLNGKKLILRPVLLGEDSDAFWKACKLSFYNTLVVPDGCDCRCYKERCLRYGLYLLSWKEWEQISGGREAELPELETVPGVKKNPDFELNVVQQGVLIENKCIFQNVSDYTVECIVCKEECTSRQVRRCSMETDIPPGSSRYMEYPFEPLEEAGKYIYRVRLIRKKDTAWAAGGEAAAEGEAVIMNFFSI